MPGLSEIKLKRLFNAIGSYLLDKAGYTPDDFRPELGPDFEADLPLSDRWSTAQSVALGPNNLKV